jgi:hypothetical protein
VMKSVNSWDGLTHSYVGSHTFWTLMDDKQMVLYLLDMVMVAQRWEKIPHPWHYTLETIMHWMENVELVMVG